MEQIYRKIKEGKKVELTKDEMENFLDYMDENHRPFELTWKRSENKFLIWC
ncbi:MAG: hypothetical protein P8X74_03640 [Reinekea sp.]